MAFSKPAFSARLCVWLIADAWVIAALLNYTGVISPEMLARHGLGAEDGFLVIQFLTYSFLTPPGADPLWGSLVLAFSIAWLNGLVGLSRPWLDGRHFIRIYSLATLVVAPACWAFMRISDPDAVIFGTWATVGVFLGAAVGGSGRRTTGYMWGRPAMSLLALTPVAVLLFSGGFGTASLKPYDHTWLTVVIGSWVVWPFLALVRMPAVAMLFLWCIWRCAHVANSWGWSEPVGRAALVSAVAPVIVGLVYGIAVRRFRRVT